MDFLKVLILGIVEGITEFLPISSTGHLILVGEFLTLEPKEFQNAFNVIIQLGAILSVVVLYFNTLNPLDKKKLVKRVGKEKADELSFLERFKYLDKKTMRLIAKIIVGVIPAMVLGLLFDDLIDKYLFNKITVAIALIFYGIIIIIMERRNKTKSFKFETLDEISLKTAFFIGFFQCLAMVPGTSRSAATIIGAMILGCSRTASAEFSFFLAIPTMFGASLLKIVKYFSHGGAFTGTQTMVLLTGTVVSFVVAYLSIRFLLNYIKNNDFKAFGWYRIILSVLVIAYFGFFAK